MPGRFPLFADACINGHVIDALVRQGWDVVRAVDLRGERAKDVPLFEDAAVMERVFVTNDGPIERIAIEWLRKGRPFRMIFYGHHHQLCVLGWKSRENRHR